jgi:hypothetical protein
MNTSQRAIKMAFWSLLLLVLLSYPVAAAFNKPFLLFGVPLGYWYFFGVWGAFILVLYRFAKSNSPADE